MNNKETGIILTPISVPRIATTVVTPQRSGTRLAHWNFRSPGLCARS